MLRIHPLLFLLCFIAACSPDIATSDSGVKPTPFFDLEAYFDREMARLDQLQPKLEKTAGLNGEVEKKPVEDINFERELRVFRRSDINRPSWSDKYQIDSIRENGLLKTVRYTALDTSLYTRLLRIDFLDGEVDKIQIRNRANSVIADTEQNLLYLPGRSYRIESAQKAVGAEKQEIIIEVKIKK